MQKIDINKFIAENGGLENLNKRQNLEYAEFSNNDTYVIRDFKIAAQYRLFWSFVEKCGIPEEESCKYKIFYYYNGRNKSLNPIYVFMCRENIQPSKWFYKVDEKLPRPINFTPKHSVKELQYLDSLGHIKLKELHKKYGLTKLSQMYDLNPQQVKNIMYKRLNPYLKKECFKIMPQDKFIIKMREAINPDYWFIFPDEIEE